MKRVEFKLPEGLSVPDDVSTNGEFDALATIRLKKDGKVCLVAIDGYRMPGFMAGDKEDDGESGYSEDKRGYAQAASDAMDEMA